MVNLFQLDAESVMFRDGRRKIDMMLCYEQESEGVMTEIEARRKEQRRIFEENLIKEGLEIELEDKSKAFDEKTYFLKVHIPWRTETRIAEVMNLKLPVKQFITISVKAWVSVALNFYISDSLNIPDHLRTTMNPRMISRIFCKSGGGHFASGQTLRRSCRRMNRAFIGPRAAVDRRSSLWSRIG